MISAPSSPLDRERASRFDSAPTTVTAYARPATVTPLVEPVTEMTSLVRVPFHDDRIRRGITAAI